MCINDVTRGLCLPGTYSYNYTASDSNANMAYVEVTVKIVELGKMNTTITVGPYYSVDSANVAGVKYLEEGSNERRLLKPVLRKRLFHLVRDL